MKVLIALFMLVGMAQSYKKYSSSQLRKLYREKKVEYKMDGLRSARDEKEHFKEFCKFANMVKQHNEDYGAEWQGEINKFALMTEAERELYHGLNGSSIEFMAQVEKRSIADDELDLVERADSVDYTNKLTPIKDQGSCGSCWAFCAMVPLEYQVNRRSKSKKVLSEQQFLDCTYESKAGQDGCNGGWPAHCYTWTQNNGNSVASQKDYPYVARDGSCKTNVKNAISGFKVEGTKYLKGDSHLYAAVKDSNIGVLAVAIGVYGTFHSYKSGVFSATGCDKINHGVDIVGYGSLNGVLYWQVRNSWGSSWGDKGYLKMKRGPNVNTCAIASYAHYPIVTGSPDDDKKKTCEWKKVSKKKLKGGMTKMTYTLDEAKKKCEEEEECKGLSCRSDKKCMLNKSAKVKSNKKFTGYLCN